MIDVHTLKSILNQSTFQKDNPAVYQVIETLINAVAELQDSSKTSDSTLAAGTLRGRLASSNGPEMTIKLGTGISMTGDTIHVP